MAREAKDKNYERDENVHIHATTRNPKLAAASLKQKNDRKTLQVLQQTPDNRLTHRDNLQSGNKSNKIVKKPFAVFKDSVQTSTPKSTKKACAHNSSQTESFNCCHCSCHEDEDGDEETAEEEAFRLMGQEEIPEDYWKDTAENRQMALEESLHENELLNSEVAALRKENRRLSELAENAEYFANILKEITEDSDDVQSKGELQEEYTNEESEDVSKSESSSSESDSENTNRDKISDDKSDTGGEDGPTSSSTPVAVLSPEKLNVTDDLCNKLSSTSSTEK